ncbi:AmmeMemoRadiSam system protein A [Marinobacterium sp. YM272]|uniref:AmmeMemoRadiSam system protein A n=1 Tax=Marinobacterium sp. YM272 TaxID=3421654 RepID=UPI003D7F5C7D
MAVTSFTEQQLVEMVDLARHSLLSAFGRCDEPDIPDWLSEPGACFVTLTSKGQLRGCIGTLEPRVALGRDLFENARRSAFSDPRFAPLGVNELQDIKLEISVLTPFSPIAADSEEALLAQLRPGRDGLIVEDGVHRATFLPSVWEQLGEPLEFISALRRKAGLSADAWSDQMRWYRYETQHAEAALVAK